jgi:hypothetical protein
MTPGLVPAEPGRIGSDESGKGDFFGPLVVAAFFMPEGQEEVLRELKRCLRMDRARTTVSDVTALGIVEMTRPHDAQVG